VAATLLPAPAAQRRSIRVRRMPGPVVSGPACGSTVGENGVQRAPIGRAGAQFTQLTIELTSTTAGDHRDADRSCARELQ